MAGHHILNGGNYLKNLFSLERTGSNLHYCVLYAPKGNTQEKVNIAWCLAKNLGLNFKLFGYELIYYIYIFIHLDIINIYIYKQIYIYYIYKQTQNTTCIPGTNTTSKQTWVLLWNVFCCQDLLQKYHFDSDLVDGLIATKDWLLSLCDKLTYIWNLLNHCSFYVKNHLDLCGEHNLWCVNMCWDNDLDWCTVHSLFELDQERDQMYEMNPDLPDSYLQYKFFF